MKKISFALLLCITTFIGCKSNKEDKIEESVTKSFSNLKTLDTFKISLTGTKPDDMTLNFSIKTDKGAEIYNVKIKGTELLGSADPNVDLRKEEDQIAFIKNIAKDFFSEDNFLEPAVMPEDKADDYAPDKAFYDELKKSGLNGFKYRLGKENNIYIAWSEKEQKVKIYYNCC